MLQKIVGVGAVYMILSAVETYMKLVQPKNIATRNVYAASLLLALMDAALCFWIFSSLVQTVRTLRLRRYMATPGDLVVDFLFMQLTQSPLAKPNKRFKDLQMALTDAAVILEKFYEGKS